MFSTLRGHWGWVLGLLLVLARPAGATHLLGGEMTYRYLDAKGPAAAPLRYEITVTVYNNCGSAGIASPRSDATVGIYDQATGNQIILTATNYAYVYSSSGQTGMMSIPQSSQSGCISPVIPPGCNITGVSQPYILQKFVGVVNLPTTTKGYYALFTDGARNIDITNLVNPGSQALTLYVALSPPQLPNSSPVFSDIAVAIICANDTTFLLNNAVDADGDRLVYSFGQPYGTTGGIGVLPVPTFLPPPPTVPYAFGAGYAPATPFGTTPGNVAMLNPSTGVAMYRATLVGRKYVIAVDIKEYRTVNGQEVLIGTTRRDLQLVVASCPTTRPPLLPPALTTPRSYTIEAGSTLTVPITATQADNHPLQLTLNSELLDGPGGHNATFNNNPGTPVPGLPTGTAVVSGTNGTVTGTLVFASACTEARLTPYDVALTLKDVGCAGKTAVDVLHITVVKPRGPSAISGDQAVCGLNTVHAYSATGGTAASVVWRAVGGTFVNGNTGSSVQVQWPTAGAGRLVAKGYSQYGCALDSVVQNVVIAPAPTLTVSGNQSLCQGSSTTITVAGSSTYTVTGGPATLTGAGPFTLSPAQTTTYTVTGAAVSGGCSPSTQVVITVNPLPGAVAGPAVSTCAGVPAQLGGAAVAGLTYSWSPATGLSSPTVANPTVTLPNATGAALAQTYTLTVTNAATTCTSSATVAVTVQPLPGAVAGPAVSTCAGVPAQLGGAAVAGLTYSWSPATGLSSPTVANPTVTLPNATGAALAQTYTLTVTNAATTCTSSATVAVTVNPAVGPGSIGSDQAVCPGSQPAPLTSSAGASGGSGNYAYQWESSMDKTTWAAIAGATSAGYAPGPVAAAVYFRRRVASGGCDPATSNVVAVQLQPLLVAGVQLATPAAQCAGTTFTFSPVPSNAGAAPTYRWFVNNNLAATGATFSSATLAAGDQVRVELTPTAGFCATGPALATVAISLTPVVLPTVAISLLTPLPVCAGTALDFKVAGATAAGTSPQYQWQVDGADVPGAQGPTFTTTKLRDGQAVTVVLRTATACGSVAVPSTAVRVVVVPGVRVSAGPDKVITEGEQVVLEGSADGSYPVVWTPALGLTFGGTDQLHPQAAPAVTTVYTLSAKLGDCTDQSSVTVTVTPRIRIPSAFSPNGDGQDDTWQIDHIGDYAANHVLVLNRWGSKIFETTGYNRSSEWNGSIGGQPAPIGTYYYVITLGNGKAFSGPITVVY